MSIRVVCPNGHVLNVKETLSGKSGLCPMCKAKVVVPELAASQLSEDAILSILGPSAAGSPAQAAPVRQAAPVETAAPLPAVEHTRPPNKSCHRCNREILAGTHICPFCHTYIAELSDF